MEMESIKHRIMELRAFLELTSSLRNGETGKHLGLPRSVREAVVTCLHEATGRPILFVTDRADRASILWDEADFWLSTERALFPEPAPLFYERAGWGQSVRAERIRVLGALGAARSGTLGLALPPAVIISSVRSLMMRTIPPAEFIEASRMLCVGDEFGPARLLAHLVHCGFERTNNVLQPGEFAARGGIVDVWAPTSDRPSRLDYIGDSIDSIRLFEPSSQRTLAGQAQFRLIPAREYLVPIDSPDANQFTEFDIPRLHEKVATLLDFLPENALVVLDDLAIVEEAAQQLETQALALRASATEEGIIASSFPLPYVPWSELRDQLSERQVLDFGHGAGRDSESSTPASSLALEFRHDARFAGQLKLFSEYAGNLLREGANVIVVSRQSERLQELMADVVQLGQESRANKGGSIEFVERTLAEGFVLGTLHLLTDSEVFGWERPRLRARRLQAGSAPESVFADMQDGDYIVHIEHGVGMFRGLTRREIDGRDHDYIRIEYESGELFVPVHQADRITRYVGADGSEPALDRLGATEWHEKQTRVREAVAEVAKEMLELHAKRALAAGYAFKADTAWQRELEDSFPYVETADQVAAMREIKLDMETERPMDRLLCGDVGYGKTELALRAAFKAVMDGRQVAVLVPTTVLAQQHFETFGQRLSAFPVKVEMLSRFRTPQEQAAIVRALSDGAIDIVIGTHRLLSSDVNFPRLGLVIIDEEQRFGVTHKERLKNLRTEVDVLTLTATPIPRTLYMALTGVRDISNLNTAPEERLPIITHVGPYSTKLVRKAVLRELERGGQIYFVHNRVHSIEAMRAHLRSLVPEARVDVGHGQMDEKALAAVMHRFDSGEVDILLCTTIIESGLDIPNANTLIVDRADAMGLAQLYQLRGRVGRGAARAYAYFFRHNKLAPTVEGYQRLEVIAENTELGSGYSIAMRDLEIRGAGELLGTQQHGHIQLVGFHLYTRLLADAVRALKQTGAQGVASASGGGDWLEQHSAVSMPVTVDLPLPIGIPSDYITEQDLRLKLYRRIAALRDEPEVQALQGEFTDRFGQPPVDVQNLLYQMMVKLRAERCGLASVSWQAGQVVLRYPPGKVPPVKMPELGAGVRQGKGAFWCSLGHEAEWRPRLLEILARLSSTAPIAALVPLSVPKATAPKRSE